ncbi:MAG: hexokinase [Lentisphaerae bacterium]|nr:hexokinase [Lentisphaerota bacterium]
MGCGTVEFDVKGWLRSLRVEADLYSADELIDAFIAEMECGLAEQGAGSLAMIPSYVGAKHGIPRGRPVAVIDAGGTNLRSCLALFDAAGSLELSHFTKQPMLGTRGELSAAAFFSGLADSIESLMAGVDAIGFCFSFPAVITPACDGRLLHWTKEIEAPEVEGQCVGAGLLQALAERGHDGKQVAVLNDTAAALLAGKAQGEAFGASSYVGFILGTGTNSAYVEQNRNIGKLPELEASGSQVINVESGAFSRFERGALDLKLDRECANPGTYSFEKIISGVYMGPLALELYKAACGEGLFSERGTATIMQMENLTTIHIDNLRANDGRDTGLLETDAFTDADRDFMRTVFTAVVNRAALLTAVNISAAVIKSGAGQDAAAPVCVNIDGSTYYKTTGMAQTVQTHLAQILEPRGLHIRCIHVADAPIVGAAIAALTMG